MILIQASPLQEIDNRDESAIENIVRNLGSIVTSPSNIKDQYDIGTYKDNYYGNGSAIKVLLDNNIVTRIISIIRNASNESYKLDQSERHAAALICFFIICNIQINPSLAYYEKPNDEPNDNDYLFKVADHLPPQCFADIALNRKNFIESGDLMKAIKYLDDSPELQSELQKSSQFLSQEIEEHEGYCLAYQKLLKATLLLRSTSSSAENLSNYLDWSYSESLSLVNIDLFIMILLSNQNPAISRLLKKPNTRNHELLIKNLKNSAWDISYMNLWTGLHSMEHQHSQGNVIWLFASNDKALIEFSKILFRTDSYENIRELFSNYYDINSTSKIIKYIDNVKIREEPDQHKNRVMSGLTDSTGTLVQDIKNLIIEE